MLDHELCYRAALAKDARFDGVFFGAVTTTGIYCRPSCPARTPKPGNIRFYPTAAAAQQAGFRACRRCRPDATPGSPEWNVRADLVGRAMRLIADGAVDRDGVAGLARRLGYSERHLTRQLTVEVGAGPLALARAQRAQTARILLETTGVAVSEIAFAAGFASIRQFNDTIREVFAATPTELRRRSATSRAAAPGTIALRLPYRAPFDAAVLAFLGERAVPGVEEYDGTTYRRSLRLAHGTGVVDLSDAGGYVSCLLRLDDVRDLAAAVQRCRRLLDLDADPLAIDAALGADPLLAPLVARRPGLRVPGHVDGDELAVRAVLGQQVSVAGARTIAGRLVQRYGKPLTAPSGGVTHLFPDAATLAGADPADLPMPAGRKRAFRALNETLASGDVVLDAGADRTEVEQRLLALPGIGPWTVAAIRLRALGDPDVFMAGDLGVRKALDRLGPGADPQRWRPWRSYALTHLWESL